VPRITPQCDENHNRDLMHVSRKNPLHFPSRGSLPIPRIYQNTLSWFNGALFPVRAWFAALGG